VVRDIYQQNIKRDVSERTIARLSRWTTFCIGILAMLCILQPPAFLQTLVVFASGGLGACFLAPVLLALYWKRMTATAAVAGMLSGALVILGLYLIGWRVNGEFGEYNLLGIHPFLWASLANLLVLVGVSLRDQPPDDSLVAKYFGI
jgi:Na+/proline symporter